MAFRLERRLNLFVQNYLGSSASRDILRVVVSQPYRAFSFKELISRTGGSREESDLGLGTLRDSGLVYGFRFNGQARVCLSPLPLMRYLAQQVVIATERGSGRTESAHESGEVLGHEKRT